MEKITYKLTTLSSLIASPRSSAAWYEDLGGFSLSQETNYLNKDKLKIIYPFYQYGEYTKYAPESAEYYLPGTSVKGMLCQGPLTPADIMVDDVHVLRSKIVLRNLFKAQYLNDEHKAHFGAFFENIGIEMIKAGTELTGEIYIKDNELMKELFYSANQLTKVKLNQMIKYLCACSQKQYDQALLGKFCGVIKKMHTLLGYKDLFLLGGYKGLLHSMNMKKMDCSETKSGYAIYLDIETMLPHGLIRVASI